jgi:hypothetical protein
MLTTSDTISRVGAFVAAESVPGALLWMRHDALPIVIQMLTSGRYKLLKLKTASEAKHAELTGFEFIDGG